ncbi:MAG TPA: translocation/assembly module TamB domain-containing protein [Burkholderiales bacterium]
MDWNLDAGGLSAFGPGFSGKATASGWFSGTPEQPAFGFDLQASRLRLPEGIAAGALKAEGEYAPGDQGVLRGRLEAQKAELGGYALDALSAVAEGTPARHEFSLVAQSADLDLQATAEGGFAPGPRWSGTLLRLVTAKPYAGALAAPTAITVAANELEIGAAELAVGGARLALERLAWRDGRLNTRGRFSALPLALLLKPTPRATWRSDLIFSGNWDIEAGAELNGELRIARESGDIRLGTLKPLQLGLGRLALEARARNSLVEASAVAEGERLGLVRAAASTRLERGAAGWHFPEAAPLSGELQGRIPNLSWLGPMLDPILATGGSLDINAAVSGTVGDPVIQGQVAGKALEAHVDATGLHLTGGTLVADFTGDRLVVREFLLQGGAGTLKTSGAVSFAGGRREGALDFTLDRLAIVDMPGQKLQVSGSGKLALENARLALSGAIRADQGLIELREWNRPSLSDDVVIVGRERPAPGSGAAPGLRLALDLDLGDNFRVRGTGLDARLVGAIQIRSDEGPTRAKGVVRVAEGSYTAYGQRLQIERGALMFDGQITNPALDILALRKNQRVEAGVAITGTVLSPRTRLVSFPPVPDAEKLSWLVLGQGTGSRDDSVLSLPSVGAAAKDSEYVSVGAQITSSLHIGLGRSITGTGTLLKLTYLISDRWSVQTRSGDASGASVYYTISVE